MPKVLQLEIHNAATGIPRTWLQTRYELFQDHLSASQQMEYQFIADGAFTLSDKDTVFAVIDTGQRLALEQG